MRERGEVEADKSPGWGSRRAASITTARPPTFPQAYSQEPGRKAKFPPRLSTAVEGLCRSAKHLQSDPFCSVFAGWYARRSCRSPTEHRGQGEGWSTKSS